MISYSEARQLIEQSALGLSLDFQKNKTEEIDLFDCVGRTLATSIIANVSFPAFETSAMDGFAISAASSNGASSSEPHHLRILGTISAGMPVTDLDTPAGSAWKIMTGAALPSGCDSCVKIEDVSATPSPTMQLSTCLFENFKDELYLSSEISCGSNVRQIGEDFAPEQNVFDRGHRFRHEDVLILATLGVTRLRVFCRPRVALIATGNELVEHSTTPATGHIRNSTLPYLSLKLRSLGCQVVFLGNAGDRDEDFLKKLALARQESFDLILSTGGISVGQGDRVAQSVEQAGGNLIFQKVKIRPGKPVLFALFPEGVRLIGLPGNPIASIVAYRFFVEPFLHQLQCGSTLPRLESLNSIRLPLACAFFKKTEGTEFLKARLIRDGGPTQVSPLKNQQASLLHPLLEADGWIEIPDGPSGEIAEGTPVFFHPFYMDRSVAP